MINILLIDQEPLFQQAFSRMIAETEECQLIGIAENSKEAFEIASRYHPQIVFCDVVLGIILLRSIFLRLRPIFYQITVVSR